MAVTGIHVEGKGVPASIGRKKYGIFSAHAGHLGYVI